MKLWRISQTAEEGYDTYDSAVVAAETEQLAKETFPTGYRVWFDGDWCYPGVNGQPPRKVEYDYRAWAPNPSQVEADYIGEAAEGTMEGTICASFNAG